MKRTKLELKRSSIKVLTSPTLTAANGGKAYTEWGGCSGSCSNPDASACYCQTEGPSLMTRCCDF